MTTTLTTFSNLNRISVNKSVKAKVLADQSIEIHLPLAKNGYCINVGYNLLAQLTTICPELVAKEILVVTNKQVGALYLDTVLTSLQPTASKLKVVTVANGEMAKTQPYLDLIYQTLLEHNYSRSCVILALGGGTIGDLAGFAAATYLRGVSVVQIPTTLLAQVDASIGGKTAIDHPLGKNMIGAFHQPQRVVIDLNVLGTLAPRDLSAGMGEIVKYGFIMDQTFLNWLDQHILEIYDLIPTLKNKTDFNHNDSMSNHTYHHSINQYPNHTANHLTNSSNPSSDPRSQALLDMVASCCFYKAQVILADELEKTGQRALLNFGHTYGHAIESDSNYLLPHGECVSMGMILALFLSYYLQHFEDKEQVPPAQQLANDFYHYLNTHYQNLLSYLSAHSLQNSTIDPVSDYTIDSAQISGIDPYFPETNCATGFTVELNSTPSHPNQQSQTNQEFITVNSDIDANLLATKLNFKGSNIEFRDIYQAMILIAKCRLPLFFPPHMALADFMTYIARDKKVDQGQLTFITLDYLGKAQVHKDIKVEVIQHTIDTVKALVGLLENY